MSADDDIRELAEAVAIAKALGMPLNAIEELGRHGVLAYAERIKADPSLAVHLAGPMASVAARSSLGSTAKPAPPRTLVVSGKADARRMAPRPNPSTNVQPRSSVAALKPLSRSTGAAQRTWAHRLAWAIFRWWINR